MGDKLGVFANIVTLFLKLYVYGLFICCPSLHCSLHEFCTLCKLLWDGMSSDCFDIVELHRMETEKKWDAGPMFRGA